MLNWRVVNFDADNVHQHVLTDPSTVLDTRDGNICVCVYIYIYMEEIQ
jgi:hypothetical protein